MHDNKVDMILDKLQRGALIYNAPLSFIIIGLGVWIALISGCSPSVQTYQGHLQKPKLTDRFFITSDAKKLPLNVWNSEATKMKAVVIALHGFNDHSGAFKELGNILADHGYLFYAYDQRGFGNTQNRGIWAGTDLLVQDLKEFVSLIKKTHPKLPIHALGESMGGAVILSAISKKKGMKRPKLTSVILSAPAVWGRNTMPIWQSKILDILVHMIPMVKLTPQGLNINPSDNKEMLKALRDDPLYITDSRLDTVYGLTNLMDEALEASSYQDTPLLILYGAKDDLVPKSSTCRMLSKLPNGKQKQWHLAFYPNGHHLLFRDLDRDVVVRDIKAWLAFKKNPLPSGYEVDLSKVKNLGRSDCLTKSTLIYK